MSKPVRTLAFAVLGLLVLCTITAVALLGVLFGWKTLFGRADDPGAARALFEQATKRIDLRVQTPAADNGWNDLDAYLTQDADADLMAPLRTLNDAQGTTPALTRKHMADGGAKTQQALRDFEKQVAPALHTALAKPAFAYPTDWRKGLLEKYPNFLRLRQMTVALAVHGLAMEDGKQPARAVDDDLTAIALGQRMTRQGPIISAMIGIAMMRIGLDPLARLVSSGDLAPAELHRVVHDLAALQPDPSLFVERCDEDYVGMVQSFDLAAQGRLTGMSANPGLVERVFGPMLAKRASAMYQNYYVASRPLIAKLDVDGLAADDAKRSQTIAGGMLGAFTPDYGRSMAQFVAARAILEGTVVAAALEGWKAEHGRYPATLAELSPSWLPAIPDDPATGRPFTYQANGTLSSSSPLWPKIHLPATLVLHPWSPPQP